MKVWDKNAKLTISSCSFFLVKNALFSKISFGVLYNIKICFTFTEKKLILKDNKFFWGLEIRCKYGLLTPRTLSRKFFSMPLQVHKISFVRFWDAARHNYDDKIKIYNALI